MQKKSAYFFLILLIEGAALMAVELMGAKLVAPFYGSSLYVWTAVLGFTVSGLTLGYYFGGRLTQKPLSPKTLFIILAIAALLVLALPYTAQVLIFCTSTFSLIAGICATSLLLLLPPMLCFGMVGPIVVKLLAANTPNPGRVAGTVYFISTSAGIIATFLFGFYLIPITGLRLCATITGLALAALQLIYIFRLYPLPNHQNVTAHSTQKANKDSPSGQSRRATKPQINKSTNQLINKSTYLYAAIEGGAVMAIELLAARMIAPYFGAALYVWATVMAFTLLGLALGYFIGGRLPARYSLPAALWWALLAAASCTLFMHFTAQQLTIALNTLSIKTAVLFICCALILPPLLFLGMVPTLLIRHIAASGAGVGAVTGRVFTISSASGIISLFIMGFYIIPQFGLAGPSIFMGVIVGAIPCFKLLSQKKFLPLLFIGFIIASLSVRKAVATNSDIDIPYYSEGLLGQILVADVNKYDTNIVNDRLLLVNRIGEAQIDRKTGASKWEYPYYVSSLCSKLPEKSNALMLGLGGGQIPNMLNYIKFNVDVVELDQRIVDVARDYFYLNPNINVTVDDARHYLQTTTKTYDVIIIDVFHGDIAPPHLLSIESFKKAASLLNKNGFIIVNFFGFINGDLGKPGRSIYTTMVAAGLHTKILPTTGKEDERNSLFIGSPQDQDFATLRTPLALYGKVVNIDTLFLDTKKLDLKNAVVFTDNKPSLDLLNLNGVLNFRKSYTEIIKRFSKAGVPLFQ